MIKFQIIQYHSLSQISGSKNNFYVGNYIPIFDKTIKLLVSNIQNIQNAKFYRQKIKLVYSIITYQKNF